MHQKLFTPGPSEVRTELLQAMATPQIHHRSKEFSQLYADLQPKLQKLLYTQNPVLLFTSSSTGAMESAVVNGVKKKCLNLVNGAFSKRWHKITEMNGIPCDTLSLEWYKAIKPEMIDEKLENGEYDAVTLVFNETSTGMMNPLREISEVIKKYPDIEKYEQLIEQASNNLEKRLINISKYIYNNMEDINKILEIISFTTNRK